MKMTFSLKSLLTVLIPGATLLASCQSDPLSPGIEYMPDMYRSPAYKHYELNPVFKDSLSSLLPPAGTITQGSVPNADFDIFKLPYTLPDKPEGYDAASAMKNPLPLSTEVLAQGKDLYTKFCVHCHGDAGNGDGSLVKNGKFPSPGSYVSKLATGLNEGKMFHSITYGKGLMGQHASQLDKKERWILVHYVNDLIAKAQPKPAETVAAAKTNESSNTDKKK
jgi:mono/diheme cytochrome c family protein